MPIRIIDESDATVDGALGITAAGCSTSFVGAVTGVASNDGAINRTLDGATISLTDNPWPQNGDALYGGYITASQAKQFTTEPFKSWNEQMDIFIVQGLGWRDNNVLDQAATYFNAYKQANPISKLGYYFIASEPTKPGSLGPTISGYNDEVYQLINAGPPRGTTDWYLRNPSGDLVESRFNPVLFHRANCYCVQFQTLNGNGSSFAAQFLLEHFLAFDQPRPAGKLRDLTDFMFMDVVPPLPEPVFQDGSNGATSDSFDQNNDGAAETRNDETTPANPANENGYGGARMHRRGAKQWLDIFKTLFGPNYPLWCNGTEDGIRYDFNLSSGDPLQDSEFLGQWGGTPHEDFQNDIGARPNGTGYDISYDSFETGIKRFLRVQQRVMARDQHPWGPKGFDAVMTVVTANNRESLAAMTDDDHEFIEFYGAINAILRGCYGPRGSTGGAWPRPDSYIMEWGDIVDPSYSMGTVDLTASGAPVTLRAYDYDSGGVKVYGIEYANICFLVRGDPPTIGANNFNTGSAANVPIPFDPGTGMKWIYPDFASYINPITGWASRNLMPAVYDGSDVGAGGSYGTIPMKPWIGRQLRRVAS